MTRLPVMPLWVKDLLVDTEHLTCTEFGTYVRLLCMMWLRDGSVPDDDPDLARMLNIHPRRWGRIRKRLDSMLMLREDGMITQKRLAHEWSRAKISKHQKSSFHKGGAVNGTNGLDLFSRAHDPRKKDNNNLLLQSTTSATPMNGSAAMAGSPGLGGRSPAMPESDPETVKRLVAAGLKKPKPH